MMKFAFWDDWPVPLRNVFYIFFILFSSSIVYAIICGVLGYHVVLDWEIVTQRLPVLVTMKELPFGMFSIPLQSVNYMIQEWYQGSDFSINLFAAYFNFVLTIMGMVLGFTSSTFLGKIWYYALTLAFLVALIFFKLEGILLFGLSDNTTLILIVVSYLGLSYFFYSIRTEYDFIQRFKMFLGVTILWGILIYFFSEVPRPFLLLASNGFLVPFIIGIIFVFSVSHEIIHFIVVALTRSGQTSGNSLGHFTLFSLIYLANVVLLYLYDTHVINWNFYYLNPYVLVSVSAILGLWGLQSRMALFDMEQKKYPLVVFIYLAAALCAFGPMLYFLGNANDSILQVVKDVIIYSHLGFGFIFFIYVITNFMGMLGKNMKVYQVIYKPTNMPHFIFRFAGLILVTAFFLKEDIQISVHQTLSGVFNNLGDYYKITGDLTQAQTYYENGGLYGYMNHKSNYAMAKIREAKNDQVDAALYYEYSTRVRPSEMSFVNLSNTQSKSGDFFKSLFTLNDGQRKFPSGKAILNNKGYLFSKTRMTDSAMLYFDASARAGKNDQPPVVNYLALLSIYDYGFDPDSVMEHYGGSLSDAEKANALLLKNARNQTDTPFSEEFNQEALNIYSASALTNYLLNQYKFYDSAFINRQLEKVQDARNLKYRESVDYAAAMALFRRGYTDQALEILRELIIFSRKPEIYNYVIGVMLMESGNFEDALDYLNAAMASGNTDAVLAGQVCMLELGNYDIDSLKAVPNGIFDRDSLNATRWLSWQEVDVKEAITRSDLDKLGYLHLHLGDMEKEQSFELVKSMSDDLVRTRGWLEIFDYQFRHENYDIVDECLKELDMARGVRKDKMVEEKILMAKLANVARMKDTDQLKEWMGRVDWLPFDMKWHYEAIIAESENDTLRAKRYYETLAHMNSFNEEAILDAARFFKTDPNQLRPYNILVNALLQNPNSTKLLKQYIRESYEQGLTSYAFQASNDLSKLMDKKKFEEFLNSLAIPNDDQNE